MPRILITGKNSYVGNMTEKWLKQKEEDFIIDKISMRNDEWKKLDLGVYDSIIHVAGIAHNSSDKKLEDLYYSVNRDLTVELAKKAKEDGARQFIFLSSIIVYGTKNEVITKDTKPNPDNFYGESKLQGEEGILPLSAQDLNVVIIRPPMIYGIGSKGNYPLLAKLARIIPIFPQYENKRSMIHIDNLTEIIYHLILDKKAGIFHPQNKEPVKTSDMVKNISDFYGKKLYQTKLFNPIIRALSKINIVNKVFGNLYYEPNLSYYPVNYQINDLRQSIERTEGGN